MLDLSGQEINHKGAEHLANALRNNKVIFFNFPFPAIDRFTVTDAESIEP